MVFGPRILCSMFFRSLNLCDGLPHFDKQHSTSTEGNGDGLPHNLLSVEIDAEV